MFNEEEEEEEEYEENEENNNYRYFRRFWRIKREFEQQNYIQTFNNNNNQIPSISAIINLNGVPQQQTFPPPFPPPPLSHQFLPTFPQYPQQQFIPQSPSDSQSIQMQLSNESTTDSNNSFKNNNEFGRKKRRINKNHQFQNSPIFKSSQQQQYPYSNNTLPWQKQNYFPNSRFNKRILHENRWKQKVPKNNLINKENKQNVGEKILVPKQNTQQQQQYSSPSPQPTIEQLNNHKLEQKKKIRYNRTNLLLGVTIICMLFSGICFVIILLRI